MKSFVNNFRLVFPLAECQSHTSTKIQTGLISWGKHPQKHNCSDLDLLTRDGISRGISFGNCDIHWDSVAQVAGLACCLRTKPYAFICVQFTSHSLLIICQISGVSVHETKICWRSTRLAFPAWKVTKKKERFFCAALWRKGKGVKLLMSSQVTSEDLHANLRANLLMRPVWTGPELDWTAYFRSTSKMVSWEYFRHVLVHLPFLLKTGFISPPYSGIFCFAGHQSNWGPVWKSVFSCGHRIREHFLLRRPTQHGTKGKEAFHWQQFYSKTLTCVTKGETSPRFELILPAVHLASFQSSWFPSQHFELSGAIPEKEARNFDTLDYVSNSRSTLEKTSQRPGQWIQPQMQIFSEGRNFWRRKIDSHQRTPPLSSPVPCPVGLSSGCPTFKGQLFFYLEQIHSWGNQTGNVLFPNVILLFTLCCSVKLGEENDHFFVN